MILSERIILNFKVVYSGCYDPIRKVVTIRDGCFADHHCAHLPNTICTLGKYHYSCKEIVFTQSERSFIIA